MSRFFTSIFLLAILPLALQATWYEENVEDGSDLIQMDLRWPWWCSGTYYANWNSSFNPSSKITFYAGFTSTVPNAADFRPNLDPAVQDAHRPDSVWSFWGGAENGEPVRFIASNAHCTFNNTYIHEGACGSLPGFAWQGVKSGAWHTMLARVWRPLDGGDCSYIGRWIKDGTSKQWRLIGIARLPLAATSFKGNCGFIEPLGAGTGAVVHPLDRRFGYCRKDGKWRKADMITIDKSKFVAVNVIAEGEHEYAAIEYSQKPDLMPMRLKGPLIPSDKRVSFKVRQADLPQLDKPLVGKFQARTNGRQIQVDWEIPAHSSPSFAYKLEVFDNPECRGMPRASRSERMPHIRSALLDVDLSHPYVRLTMIDVYDQAATPVIAAAVAADAPAPSLPVASSPGLEYELILKEGERQESILYHALLHPNERHAWIKLDEIGTGKLVQSGISRGFDSTLRGDRNQAYAMRFKGYLRAPASGLYLLRANIDGAYQISIAGQPGLIRDDQLGSEEKTLTLHLGKGDHPFEALVLIDKTYNRNFQLDWEGPGFGRQAIPLDALRHRSDDSLPQVQCKASALAPGCGKATVEVSPGSHRIQKVVLFLGSLQLAESQERRLEYQGSLPAGENSLWTRVFYDQNQTVDGKPLSLAIDTATLDSSWSHRNAGDQKSRFTITQSGPGSYAFFGEGTHFLSRKVKGDFTLTCRVDACNGLKGEPVNPASWIGLSAQEHPEYRPWEWGQQFYIIQTGRQGLRVSPDFSDLGASRMSSFQLPKDRPWLRLVRQGQVWTAWTSVDGQAWELGAWQFRPAMEEVAAGLFINSLPQHARAHFTASVSRLAIEPGLAQGMDIPRPAAVKDWDGMRRTGVIMAASNPAVLYLRSSGLGLLRSGDGGKSWQGADGQLKGDALFVRSVAVHPSDPQLLLRACGRGRSGSSLWLSRDGGASWNKLDFDGDFDGEGPSALCGEILAFDPQKPDTVFAGCESRGFFRSDDLGRTWRRTGLEGERITCVRPWPWEAQHPSGGTGQAQLGILTCPDEWMRFLGRGEPSVPSHAKASFSRISRDGGRTFHTVFERVDTGLYNLSFEKGLYTADDMSYATTHGLQGSHGSRSFLHSDRKNLEWLRPCTAIASSGNGEGTRSGRSLTQALTPGLPGRLAVSTDWQLNWQWQEIKGDVPKGGLVSAAADPTSGRIVALLFNDGLYHSTDGGQTLVRAQITSR
ncbi:MAG: hypothetical protein RL095_712 [Verrucomicrobiota bacterium]|jgi:hypothetical protein